MYIFFYGKNGGGVDNCILFEFVDFEFVSVYIDKKDINNIGEG